MTQSGGEAPVMEIPGVWSPFHVYYSQVYSGLEWLYLLWPHPRAKWIYFRFIRIRWEHVQKSFKKRLHKICKYERTLNAISGKLDIKKHLVRLMSWKSINQSTNQHRKVTNSNCFYKSIPVYFLKILTSPLYNQIKVDISSQLTKFLLWSVSPA